MYFMTAANAVLPIVLLILAGCLLRKLGMLSDGFLDTGNKLVFRLCLPVTLFMSVYSIESMRSIRWDVVVYCLVVTLLLFGLGFALAVRSAGIPERRGVILQCVFRSNFAIIGLPLAAAVGGPEAEAVAAVVSAFLVPAFNVLAVLALTMFDDGNKTHRLGALLKNLLKNPLIKGIAAAFVCLLLRQWQMTGLGRTVFTIREQLPFLYSTLTMVKNCTTPLALMVLGGQFVFSAARQMRREIVVGTLWRVVLAPLLGVGLAVLLSRYTNWIRFGPNEYPALIGLFGSPVAVSSAVMAKQMGGDAQLATQYVVWTSICSMITVFLLVYGMIAMGLLAA